MDIESLKTACVCHYRLDDNAPTTVVLDAKGFSNGTAQRNTSLMHAAGKVGGALALNGTSDYIDTGSTFQNIFSKDFSIAFWFNPALPLIDYDMVTGLIDSQGRSYFYLNLGATPPNHPFINVFYSVNYENNSLSNTVDTLISSGEWHFVVVSYKQVDAQKAEINIYLDGELGANSQAEISLSDWLCDGNFTIGSYAGGHFWQAVFDDFMVFNQALSQDDVNYLYNGGAGIDLDGPTIIQIGGADKHIGGADAQLGGATLQIGV
ncbi:MAG: LamG domain-containing protein [Thermoguttaceae bacterium]